MFLELLIVIIIQAQAIFGVVGGYIFLGIVTIVCIAIAFYIAEFLTNFFLSIGTSPTSRERQRVQAIQERKRTASICRMQAMSLSELRQFSKANPKDPEVQLHFYDRLKENAIWPELAAQMQFLLANRIGFTSEEESTRYHQLADIYLHELKQPQKAVEVLEEYVRLNPNKEESRLTRQRIRRLKEGPPSETPESSNASSFRDFSDR